MQNWKSFLIGAILILFLAVGGGLAVFMALKTNTTAPVAPTVPQAKPRAEEPRPSDYYSCQTDSDCACGKDVSTQACAYGNVKYIDSKSQCPDFCSGFAGNLIIKCLSGSCAQINTKAEPACRLSFKVASLPAFTCDKIVLSPDSQTIGSGGETRNLTVNTSGGTGSLTYAWAASGGTLSSTNVKTVTWTAPSGLSSSQTWNISVVVTDGQGKTASGDNCKVNLSYNPGCNSSCQIDANCPNDLSCVSGRCRQAACPTQSDCKCPPPKKVCNDTCTVNSDCESQYICAGGNCRNPSCINEPTCVCKPVLPTCNSTCTTSADCPSNLGCVSGRCRNTTCPTSTTCACIVPTCNSTCTTSVDCPNNLACANGRCRNAACPEMVGCVCQQATHKECQGQACVTVAGVGTDTCTSDVSCRPAATPPPIPESGNPLLTA